MTRVLMTTALLLCCMASIGCVRRTITVTSDPSGALVWLNDREIGRTPVDVDFIYYGDYDVRLVYPGYEPLLTNGKANPPLWDSVPLDFAAEISPFEHHAKVQWHFVMQPSNDDMDELIDRARAMRDGVTSIPADESSPES